ncbi:MAG: DNA repair protein RecN [Lachnospiraceae bacterium]|nr:DNA repair protein RecN [Lachnospiraceae bacterium]
MLESIHIKNMALIEELEVAFGKGLNILTGETGAGKSVIIGAVNIALGGKAPKDIIRTGADSALAELDFTVEDPAVLAALEALDLPLDGNHVFVSRRVTESRSVSRINGEPVSLSELRKAAPLLLDIHGQHELQSLLHRSRQLEILDRFAGAELAGVKASLREEYRAYRALKEEMDGASLDEGKRMSDLDFLIYQKKEIDEAGLRPGEEEELDKVYRRMNSSRDIMENVSEAHEITGYDAPDSAGNAISRALRAMQEAAKIDEEAQGLASQLLDIDVLLNDFNRDLSGYMEGLSFDEAEYRETEKRLDLISRLEKKYGNDIEAVLKYRENCEAQIAKLENYSEYLDGLKRDLAASEKRLSELSEKVTGLRKEEAAELEGKILAALKDLNFLDVRFRINLADSGKYSENGRDEAAFMISTNPGEELKPLAEVASGGELSRIMLAIKSVLADTDEIDTLIFDEIDSGISGRTAQKVSERMAVIARSHQVLAITHLPQIAAMADNHYSIEKTAQGGRAVTEIRKLSAQEETEEVARLLGGVRITDSVRKNAEEMKELAREQKARL